MNGIGLIFPALLKRRWRVANHQQFGKKRQGTSFSSFLRYSLLQQLLHALPHAVPDVYTQHQLKVPDLVHHSENFKSHFMPRVFWQLVGGPVRPQAFQTVEFSPGKMR